MSMWPTVYSIPNPTQVGIFFIIIIKFLDKIPGWPWVTV